MWGPGLRNSRWGLCMCYYYNACINILVIHFLTSGREESQIKYIEEYTKAAGLFRDYKLSSQDPVFSEVLELDLSSVVPSVSGPKRPHDRVSVSDFKEDFLKCLNNKVCLLAS